MCKSRVAIDDNNDPFLMIVCEKCWIEYRLVKAVIFLANIRNENDFFHRIPYLKHTSNCLTDSAISLAIFILDMSEFDHGSA